MAISKIEKGNKDPVQVERVDVFSLPTIRRIEVLSRSNQYAATPVEARDQSQVEIFGPRVGSTIQAHEICDEFVMAPKIAQTILQRELYVRTKFTFKLSWEYCLLDPMDIVTLTDANLGPSNYPSGSSRSRRTTRVCSRSHARNSSPGSRTLRSIRMRRRSDFNPIGASPPSPSTRR